MENLEKKIYDIMKENRLFGEIVNINGWTVRVDIEITWGDWKHEHWRLDYLMKENFKIASTFTETTEENGSDCYSAIHHYWFLEW